jgi:hypothetical protein
VSDESDNFRGHDRSMHCGRHGVCRRGACSVTNELDGGCLRREGRILFQTYIVNYAVFSMKYELLNLRQLGGR